MIATFRFTKLRLILALLAGVGVALAIILARPTVAHAETKCYIATAGSPNTPAAVRVDPDCGTTRTAYQMTHPGEDLKDDHCYRAADTTGWSVLPPEEFEINSQQCKDLAEQTQVNEGAASKCYNVDKDPRDYHDAEQEDFKEIDCNAKRAEIKQGSARDIEPGVCYVFIKDVYEEATPCVLLMKRWATGKKAAGQINAGTPPTADVCGDSASGRKAVGVSINLGCKGIGNPIVDLVFAIVRFLSLGVGIVIIGSIVVGGIQFTTSRGDPNATKKAMTRVGSSVGALIFFLLIYAMLNWLLPGGLF